MLGEVKYEPALEQKWYYRERGVGSDRSHLSKGFDTQEEAIMFGAQRFKNRWTQSLTVYRENGTKSYTQRYETIVKKEEFDA